MSQPAERVESPSAERRIGPPGSAETSVGTPTSAETSSALETAGGPATSADVRFVPRDVGFSVVVALAAALAMLVDLRHEPKLDALEPAWIVGVYGVVPFSAAVLLDTRRTVARALAVVALVAASSPVIWRTATSAPRTVFLDQPELLLGPVGVGLALLVVAGLVGELDLDAWGLGPGDWRWWAPRAAAIAGLFLPMVLVGAFLSPKLLEYYPEAAWARDSWARLGESQLLDGVYMLGWEAFWRGFLLFGLGRRHGRDAAVIAQAFPFFLLHRSKPELEMASSMVGGMLLGWFCWRGRSAWPAIALHWVLHTTMEVVGFLG